MSHSRRSLLVLGIASSLIGLLLITSPTLATIVELSGTIRAIPFVLIGLVALILGVRYLFTGMKTGSETRTPSDTENIQREANEYPTPENRPQYAHPGTQFKRKVRKIKLIDRRETEPATRLALRTELREIAIMVLSRTEDWTRAEREARLNNGNWTEDPQAAAFFADSVVPSLSMRERLRSLWTTEPPFARRARHAIAELASRYDGTDVPPTLFESASETDRTPVTTRQYWSPHEPETSRVSQSGRTQWVTAAALIAGGFGVLTVQPALLLLALFGITVAGYTRIATPPSGAVEITRTISDSNPDSEQEIDVTVSIRNSSRTTLADIRVIDGIPAGFTVTEGSPRFTTALRPDKVASFEYSVKTVSGIHEFDPLLCITRDMTGIHKRETLVDGGSSAVTCLPTEIPESNPRLRPHITIQPGRTRSTVEGSGVEFHSVRDHRHNDPLSRINWKRKAKTGELTTIDFQEPQLATVVVVIDARADAYLTSTDADDWPIIRQSLSATRSMTTQLLSERIPVGVTALSPQSCWIPPGTGDAHRTRIHTTLAEDPAFSWNIPEDECEVSTAVEALSQRVRRETQILFVSPLCDNNAKRVVKRLDARGYTVSVISPDPTEQGEADCTLGYASLARRFRFSDLRSAGVPVFDWSPEQPGGVHP
jgi:uncharacterized repeat protein (TIGR01451 family)